MLRCIRIPVFPHSSDRAERDVFHANPIRYRYDNFYNGFNEDCTLMRRVCCSPPPVDNVGTCEGCRCCYCNPCV